MTTEKLAIHGGEPVRTRPFGSRHSFGDPEREQLMEVMDNAHTMWTSRYKTQEFEDGFRDFTFANAVRLHGGMNPEFFEGTVVEDEARAILDR